MNKLKRFGTIYSNNMNKVIEETILNDTKQMEELYDEIEDLKKKLNKKDIEIKILKEKNEAQEIQINTLKSIISNDKVNFSDSSEIINGSKHMLQEFVHVSELNKHVSINIDEFKNKYDIEQINYTNIPTPSISKDKSIDYERVYKNKRIFKIAINKLILINRIRNFLEKKQEEIDHKITKENKDENRKGLENSEPKKYQKHRDIKISILDRFGTKPFNDNDLKNSEILQFVGEEDCFNIEYKYLVANKLNKNEENITIDDVVDFKIKYDGVRNTKTRRKEYRSIIKRCTYLFEKYNKNLGKFKISIYYLGIMSEDLWNEWKDAFDNLYKEVFKNSIECSATIQYGHNKGNKCNRFNCKIKHKDNI